MRAGMITVIHLEVTELAVHVAVPGRKRRRGPKPSDGNGAAASSGPPAP